MIKAVREECPLKTLVELYDKEPLENVLTACIFKPEMVVYICDERDSSMRKETAVDRLFKSRGLPCKARFYYINTASPRNILRAFEAVLRDYPGCVFDCSGGKDLVLLGAGEFCKSRGIPMLYIDVARQKFVDLGGCESLAPQFAIPQFSAEDVFALAGAKLVGYGHFALDDIDAEFERDVFQVWPIVCKNPAAWGETVGFFQASSSGAREGQLQVDAPDVIRVNQQVTARANLPVLERLADAGVIHGLEARGGHVRFAYKSELMKKSLQNQGIWLELYGYLTAKNSGLFHDVRTSVVVDWDNARGRDRSTRNEIDILLISGVTPVFISCKMGVPTPLALSEIKILSEKFGGERTKTVLLTGADIYNDNRPLAQRARDLGITLLDRGDLAKGDLARRLQRLVAKA